MRETTSILFIAFFAICSANIVSGMPLNRICSFYEYPRVRERKTCVVDFWNSGNIQITTNNGTLNFMLENSLNGTYTLNGEVWSLEGDQYNGTFESLEGKNRHIRYSNYWKCKIFDASNLHCMSFSLLVLFLQIIPPDFLSQKPFWGFWVVLLVRVENDPDAPAECWRNTASPKPPKPISQQP